MSVILKSITVGPMAVNCSILANPTTKEAVIIDPGGDAALIIKTIISMKVKPIKILLTHAHVDHILAVTPLKDELKIPVCLHQADFQLWKVLNLQCQLFAIPLPPKPLPEQPDIWLEDGHSLDFLDGFVIHTPGHSPGSCCFYFPAEKILFSGDTLFNGSVGRSDLLGGSCIIHLLLLFLIGSSTLSNSIKNKLYVLPNDVNVYCGHGEKTTIEHEKQYNIFVRA